MNNCARWSRLGLQGGLLSLFLRPLYLSGIIVGLDPTASSRAEQQKALGRALQTRLRCFEPITAASDSSPYAGIVLNPGVQLTSPLVPEVFITSSHGDPLTSFLFSKGNADLINNSKPTSASESISIIAISDQNVCPDQNNRSSSDKTNHSKVTIPKKVAPCGTSLNYVRDVSLGISGDGIELQRKRLKNCSNGSVEVTVADTGALQGTSIEVTTIYGINNAIAFPETRVI